jgi:hypothetical protein
MDLATLFSVIFAIPPALHSRDGKFMKNSDTKPGGERVVRATNNQGFQMEALISVNQTSRKITSSWLLDLADR